MKKFLLSALLACTFAVAHGAPHYCTGNRNQPSMEPHEKAARLSSIHYQACYKDCQKTSSTNGFASCTAECTRGANEIKEKYWCDTSEDRRGPPAAGSGR